MKIQLRIGYIALLFGLTIALFVNCKSPKTIVKHITEQPTEVERILPLNFDFNTLSRNFTTKVEGLNMTLNGQVRIKHDSVIWLTLSKVVEIGRAKLTPDSIHVIIKVQNKYYQGSYADFAKNTGININYECIQSLLLGDDMQSYPFKDVQHCVAEGIAQYTFDARTAPNLPTIQQTMYVDMVTNKIIENNINTQQGEQLQIKYSQFKDTERQKLPTQIKISFKDKANKINASIVFGKTTVNQELTFPFKIPYAAKPLQL